MHRQITVIVCDCSVEWSLWSTNVIQGKVSKKWGG